MSYLKHSWVIRLFLFALTACAATLSCSKLEDDEAIRALIKKGASLAEEHNITGILELASQDFLAMPGELDRIGIKRVLWRTFKYYGPLKVLYPRPSVEIKGDANSALAKLPFLIVRKEHKFLGLEDLRDDPLAWLEKIGENADLYRIILHFRKQDGDWLVYRALLERFTGIRFEE